MTMVALVLHLWHMVAPGGKLPAESSSARSGDGIGVVVDAPAAPDAGGRREPGLAVVPALAEPGLTSDFFFERAS